MWLSDLKRLSGAIVVYIIARLEVFFFDRILDASAQKPSFIFAPHPICFALTPCFLWPDAAPLFTSNLACGILFRT